MGKEKEAYPYLKGFLKWELSLVIFGHIPRLIPVL
jgi:hypothetical protein